MATFISDRFTSAGGENLIGHVPNVGDAWVDYDTLAGWVSGAGFISAGSGEVTWNSSRGMVRSPTAPGDAFGQYDMICRVGPGSGGGGSMAVGARWSTGAATGYLAQFDEGSGSPALYLRRYDAGVIAGISVSKSFAVWTTDRTLSIKMEDLGGGTHRISALIDGVSELSIDDPSPIAGPGFVLIGGRSARNPDFIAADTAGTNGTGPGVTLSASASLVTGSASAGSGATAAGITFALAAALLAGGASSGSGASVPGVTLTSAASLVAGLASGGGGATLNFQGAGMEFIARTGLALPTFAREIGVGYRVEVFANGLTLGSPILTSGVLTTDSNGKLPNLQNPLLVSGTTYRIVPTRQSDGESGYPRRMVAA